MSWKKAVFYGGAVLVLAACNDATAPTSPSALTKLDRAAANSAKRTTPAPQAATLVAPPVAPPVNAPFSCGNAVIHVGADGEPMIICLPPVMW